MTIIAIDPGTEQSAWIEYLDGRIADMAICDNRDLELKLCEIEGAREVTIEMVASYGMPVGKTVFETVVWVGRFHHAAQCAGKCSRRIYRKDIKMHLCGSTRAKDSNIRQALIDRFGPSKKEAVGLKKTPGPLYGVKKDLWAALAVAVAASDRPDLLDEFP